MISAEKFSALKKGDVVYTIRGLDDLDGYNNISLNAVFVAKCVVYSKRSGKITFFLEAVNSLDKTTVITDHCFYNSHVIGVCGLYETEKEAVSEMLKGLEKFKTKIEKEGSGRTKDAQKRLDDCTKFLKDCKLNDKNTCKELEKRIVSIKGALK